MALTRRAQGDGLSSRLSATKKTAPCAEATKPVSAIRHPLSGGHAATRACAGGERFVDEAILSNAEDQQAVDLDLSVDLRIVKVFVPTFALPAARPRHTLKGTHEVRGNPATIKIPRLGLNLLSLDKTRIDP